MGYSITAFIICFAFLVLIAVRFYKTISAYFWADLASLFYETLAFFLYGYNLLGHVLLMTQTCQFFEEAQKEYQNSLVFVPLSVLLCVHRGIRLSSVIHKRPKTDTEAVSMIHRILELCTSRNKDSTIALTALLNKHARSCPGYECDCRNLLSQPKKYWQEPVKRNFEVYTSLIEVPQSIKNSWRIKVLSVLINRIAKRFSKSDEVSWLVAQIVYLYMGNHYHSLVLISNIECKKPGLFLKLQLYNFRQIISTGMYKEAANGLLYVLDSLEYQKHYSKFLDTAEEVAELTLKFWFTLLKEKPDTTIMNTIGIKLFNSRKQLMNVVGKINKLSTNNVEFLVKYGVYMKMVMHDSYTASSSFNQIMRSVGRINKSKSDEEVFSILRGDTKNMMIVISLETKDFMNIVDVNSQAEKILAYTRSELVGKSVANIMPPMIAKVHKDYVQKFFKTMNSKILNKKHDIVIKNKAGIYVMCCSLKTIVPRLTGGFQGVMFAHKNKKLSTYTKMKKEATSKGVCFLLQKQMGEIFCDESLKVIGFTNKVSKLLNVSERVLTELTNKTTLDYLFPETGTEKGLEQLRNPAGAVLEFKSKNFLTEGEDEDLIHNSNAQRTLLWCRIIQERYGEDQAIIFLFSLIPPANIKLFTRISHFGTEQPFALGEKGSDFYHREEQNDKFNLWWGQTGEGGKRQMPNHYYRSGMAQEINPLLAEEEIISNSGQSQSSSVHTSSSRQSSQMAKELLDRAFSQETPASIKKLAAVIVVAFFVVISLLCMLCGLRNSR
eukprot:TRINITY_DN101_c0_g1_i2.p1 TRINITY_DN101_c0_g1~~TRINITY_DN101_c0_g1_i2.p1  ORF type:complete len:777 (+),score=60.55 TRINITY_DN101_c0_g1_i2:976-3306(+)